MMVGKVDEEQEDLDTPLVGYDVNAGGETLPPLYMIDSLAQHSCNYQVQSRWCETLPKI